MHAGVLIILSVTWTIIEQSYWHDMKEGKKTNHWKKTENDGIGKKRET